MSRLGELIRTLCPDGVEYKQIGELCGKVQRVSWDGDKKYEYIDLSSVDIKSHSIIQTTTIDKDNAPSRAQQIVREYDIIFGTTRPTLKRISYITKEYDGQVCSTGFCVVHINSDFVMPKWVYYLMCDSQFNNYVKANEEGANYPCIADGKIKRYEIPVPPMEVQEEVVRILDKFTALEAELEAELEARKKQYEHYRDNLLTFSGMGGVLEYETLENLGKFYGGLTGKNKSDFDDGNAKFATYMNVFSNTALKTDVETYVKVATGEKQNAIQYGDVLFTGSSETPDECGMSSVVTEEVNEKMYLNSFCFGLRLNRVETFEPRFLKHLFRSGDIRKQITQTASGVTRFNVSKRRFGKVVIPVPPLSEQKRIAGLLDKFEALCTDLCEGLPAEIEARRRQYEHYRDRLLTFKRI